MTPQQNDLLCRVEGDSPMGKIMRRHWMPVCMSEEVAEPDCTPLRARLLGENMVVFRDTGGRIAGHPWRSDATRNADCAVFTMDGNST